MGFLWTDRDGRRWVLEPVREYVPDEEVEDSGLIAAKPISLAGKHLKPGDPIPGGPDFRGQSRNLRVQIDRSPDPERLIERGLAKRKRKAAAK